MKITRRMLSKAVEEHIINAKQADALFEFIQGLPGQGVSFNLTNVLYYMGGLVAIGAMTLFMNLGWETYGGWGLFYLSLLYGMLGLCLSQVFEKKGYTVAAGICATFTICLTPLAVYGLQVAMGWWPSRSVYHDYHAYISWNWIFMEFATLIVGVILAWIYRYPFMIMPIAVTLLYMSMDVADLLTASYTDYHFKAQVAMYFGLMTTLLAFWVDVRSRHGADYAFWLYLFGVIAFWGGMTAQHSDSELSKFIYLCVNLILIGLGVVLVRKVFVIFGALGCAFYLGHLAAQVFKDSTLFPVALTVIGLLLIYLGTLWQKHEAVLTQKAQSLLPKPLQELLQSREE